jgi:integrase
MTLAEAATKYLLEEEAKGKASLESETYHLAPVVECCGDLQLDQVHDGTLKKFVDARLKAGLSHKTVNLSLGAVRHILHVAARKWRVDIGGGRTAPVLQQVPLLTMLPLSGFQREPQDLTWTEQRKLLSLLPTHLARMALFMLNSGVRDDIACKLRWDWELRVALDGVDFSVFAVPRDRTQVRKKSKSEFDYVVCNSVAQDVVDSMRGLHEEFVFVWRRERSSQDKYVQRRHAKSAPMPWKPVGTMNNTAWQRARKEAGLGDLHVHDLRHTVGARLREVGVGESTQDIVLWHKNHSMTAHYSAAKAREVRTALELIKQETGRENRSLRSLAKEARQGRVPSESLQQEKMA